MIYGPNVWAIENTTDMECGSSQKDVYMGCDPKTVRFFYSFSRGILDEVRQQGVGYHCVKPRATARAQLRKSTKIAQPES